MTTKTSKMKAGDTAVVRSGEFKGLTATIVDPKPFPDTDLQRRRKITVDIQTSEWHAERVYMLPRMLESNVLSFPQSAPSHEAVVLPHPVTGAPTYLPGDITDPDDPRLDPWRPDPAIVKSYVSRTMPNGEKDTEFLLKFWEMRAERNLCLVGDTQSGKTMLIQVLAVLVGKQRPSGKPLPVFTLSGSAGVTDFDLFGQPTAFTGPDGHERLVWLPGVVDLAARAGGVLYADEMNMISERFTASLHSLADHRRAFVNRQKAVAFDHEGETVFMPEVVQAHDDFWMVATINPAGYRGTGSMNEAFANRWSFVPWDYDEAVERKLVPSAAVRLFGQALREARANRAISTPVGTAALARMCEDVEKFGAETAVWMLKAMFTPPEQPKVDAIALDRSILMLLQDEQAAKTAPAEAAPTYPEPQHF